MSNNNNNLTNNLILVGLAILAIFIVIRVLPFFFRLASNLFGLALVAGIVYLIFNERARHITFGVVRQFFDRFNNKN